ncbi:MAG TPA: lytic transglycosylase domain-containing protein [Blastocatellia bacterium]|nr:lytic transglycosylase domain-containing protein [Blastocatellia bacterium]
MCKNKALVMILFIVSIAASAQAQTAAASGSGSPSSQSQGQVADATKPLKADSTGTAAEQYQSSLKTLAASYDEGLKRLADQNAKIKELFDKGLVSRRDVEQSDNSLAEARAKVENVQKEMAAAKAQALKASAEVAMISQQNSGLAWSTGNQQIDALIRYNGERYGIDPYLIYCVIHQESGFRLTAVSGKGAQGLMQLMPATAARYGVANAYDPAQSIKGGTRYLRDLLDMFDGKVDLTLAAYNAGEGAVMKYGNRIPPYQETRDYVRNIIARYNSSGLRQSASKAAL